MRGFGIMAAAVITGVLATAGCATQEPSPEGPHGIVAVSRSNDEVHVRGASCNDDQPIEGFRLTPASGRDPLTWEIRPDTDAVVRIGDVDELEQLLGDDEWTLGLDGVDDPVIELTVTWDEIDAMGVGEHRVPEVPGVDESFFDFDDAVDAVCGPAS